MQNERPDPIFFYSMLYVFSCRINNKKPVLSIVSIAFLFSFLLYGRSGIATCGSLLLLCVLFYLRTKLMVYLIIALLSFLVFYFDSLYDFVLKHSNFSKSANFPRLDMLYEYLNNVNLKTLLLGGDENNFPIIKSFSGNPHNSFIKLNLNFGGMLLFFSILVLSILKRSFNKDIFVFMVFIFYLFRVSLDSVAFVTRYKDVLFFMFLFFSFSDEMNRFFEKSGFISKIINRNFFLSKEKTR